MRAAMFWLPIIRSSMSTMISIIFLDTTEFSEPLGDGAESESEAICNTFLARLTMVSTRLALFSTRLVPFSETSAV